MSKQHTKVYEHAFVLGPDLPFVVVRISPATPAAKNDSEYVAGLLERCARLLRKQRHGLHAKREPQCRPRKP